jgi:ATPase
MELVPDTSVVVDGRVSAHVEDGEFAGATVLVPETVVSELEGQANKGRETGWDGLSELKRLLDLQEDNRVTVEYVGERPDGPGSGADMDAVIRELAVDRDATLVTSDEVQAETARSKGIEVVAFEPETREVTGIDIERYFDDTTMSVHLKTGVEPMAKRGDVGSMAYQRIDDEVLSETALNEYATDIVESSRLHPDGFVELDEPGMTIVQFREYRIAVARPPFPLPLLPALGHVSLPVGDVTAGAFLEVGQDRQEAVLVAL